MDKAAQSIRNYDLQIKHNRIFTIREKNMSIEIKKKLFTNSELRTFEWLQILVSRYVAVLRLRNFPLCIALAPSEYQLPTGKVNQTIGIQQFQYILWQDQQYFHSHGNQSSCFKLLANRQARSRYTIKIFT